MQALDHVVEVTGQQPELVLAQASDAMLEVTGGHGGRAGGEPRDRPGDRASQRDEGDDHEHDEDHGEHQPGVVGPAHRPVGAAHGGGQPLAC